MEKRRRHLPSESSQRNDVQLGKRLSWLLRHGALQEGLPLQSDGYVPVDAILQHKRYASHYTLATLQRIVASDQKQRYTLRPNPSTGALEIRANQGHTLTAVEADACLQRVRSVNEVPLAVHGTYRRYWPSIRSEGLRRMQRNHVHFAMFDVPPKSAGGSGATSGFRGDCELLIYLDVRRVLEEASGMTLYRSANNVILCAGDADGRIAPRYFERVVDRRTGDALEF